MIPTSFTGSSPPTAVVGSFSSFTNTPSLSGSNSSNNNTNNSNGGIQGNNSALLGIASLILEGRALGEDEYAVAKHQDVALLVSGANAIEGGRQSPKPSTSRGAALYEHFYGSVGGGTGAGSGVGCFSTDIASYLRRKASNSPESAQSSSPFLRDYHSNSSSESASSSVESNHNRWTQKLNQLRQESPSAHHHHLAAREQKVAVECVRSSEPEYVALAINTDQSHDERRGGDFEIIRRIALNRMNLYISPVSSAVSGGGGGGLESGIGVGNSNENFMCSLQSLASNTCLRVGAPILTNPLSSSPTPKYSAYKAPPPNPRLPTPQHTDVSSSSVGSCGSVGLQLPRNSTVSRHSSTAAPIAINNRDYLLCKASTPRIAIPTPQNTPPTNYSNSSTNNLLTKRLYDRESTATLTSTPMASRSATPTATPTAAITTTPQQGPHCDQFLRKMGLAKGDASESEEHHCDMSYVNITCTRWRAYCIKMENILARGEPICIEVYLGPVGHKILLEQWIITVKEKQPPPTMTLPSLCSAIRSQLYFSQISAWCDLIKKSDKTIYNTGRLIFSTPKTTNAAGDLATTTNILSTSPSASAAIAAASPSSTSSSSSSTTSPNASMANSPSGGAGGSGNIGGCTWRSLPRLNIFYRIKQYNDCSTACFNSKPNVHNFPNVNISENCSVSVCLKSLPRITGGIPKVGPAATTSMSVGAAAARIATTTPTNASVTKLIGTSTIITPIPAAASTPLSAPSTAAKPVATVVAKSALIVNKPTTTTILTMNCDNKTSKERHHQQLQQQQQKEPNTAVFNANHNTEDQCSHPRHDNNDDAANDGNDVDHDFDVETPFASAGGELYGGVAGGDGDSSNSSFSTNYGNLSHREKQLLKYRKRMLKRDKKQRKTTSNECGNNSQTNNTSLKMEQGGDNNDADDDEEEEDQETNLQLTDDLNNATRAQRQQQLPNTFINNSIPSNCEQQTQREPHQQHVKMISTGTQTTNNACASCGFEKMMICLKCNPLKNPVAIASIPAVANGDDCSFDDEGMDAECASTSSSSACSLSSSDIIHTPRNKAELLLQAIQRTPKSNMKHKKAKDLQQLVTAIKQSTTSSSPAANPVLCQPVKTPNNNNHMARSSSSNNSVSSTLSLSSSSNGSGSIQMQGCQVCKRQKTQHNFQPSSQQLDESSVLIAANSAPISAHLNQTNANKSDGVVSDSAAESENEKDGGKMTTAEDCVDNMIVVDVGRDLKSSPSDSNPEIMEEEYFVSSTKLTPHIERCSLVTKTYYSQLHQTSNSTAAVETHNLCSTPPLLEQKGCDVAGNKKGLLMAQFKTPTLNEQQIKADLNPQLLQQPHKQTPKPNLLQIGCSFNGIQVQPKSQNNSQSNGAMTPMVHNPLLLRRNSPKVNLTPIFCNPSSMLAASSSPIPISNGVSSSTSSLCSKSADIHVTAASPTFSFESPPGPPPTITVQKSNSAPALPNSPSLSPRFVKASGLYKRRSRHLSDRSDRSLGSDEQFSDEDIDSGMYSPFATSPVKLRTRLATVFGRKPLLGNLEESLLQRRLVPKIEVMGFKLLLGASGGFCPTQLTIPAAAYFYELKGETLSTPYLCEIRLPRKGYNVPRCGTVQATLLNPMGTVVRMFVIPYDMRDMPALHQTFVRQRILADTGGNNKAQHTLTGSDNGGNGATECSSDDALMQNGNIIDLGAGGDNATINATRQQQQRSTQCGNNNNNNNERYLGHFISAENMKSLRYSIHLRFQTSRSGRLMLHTDIRMLISRRTDCDTAAAHAKGVLEAPNELITNTVMPTNPKYSARQEQTTSSKI